MYLSRTKKTYKEQMIKGNRQEQDISYLVLQIVRKRGRAGLEKNRSNAASEY